jgi:hypothetical protein
MNQFYTIVIYPQVLFYLEFILGIQPNPKWVKLLTLLCITHQEVLHVGRLPSFLAKTIRVFGTC